jgi:hypothetical protein
MVDFPALVKKAAAAAGLAGAGTVATSDDAQATFLGKLARGTNLKALEEAKRMASAGQGADEILQKTGWFAGPDKQWRTELSDKGASFKWRKKDYPQTVPDDPYSTANTVPLPDVLKHPGLYRAYPELRDARFMGYPSFALPGTNAFHLSASDLPGYNPVFGLSGISAIKSREQNLSSVLHETQHGVQTIEGFAPGGNLKKPEVVQEAAKSLQLPTESATYEALNATDEGRKALIESYKRLGGEVEARNVQSRLASGVEPGNPMSPPWRTQDVTPGSELLLPPNAYQFRLPFLPLSKSRRGP